MITACVCPAAIDGYIVILFELVVGVITVTLDSAFIGAKYLAGDFAATTSAVIVEHDRTAYRIANAPFIALAGFMFLAVNDREDTLIYLDVLTLQEVLSQDAVQEFQFLDSGFIPASHRGVTYRDARFLVLLYLAIERKMIHELADYDVGQHRCAGHTSVYRSQRETGADDSPVLSSLVVTVGLEHDLMDDGLFDVCFCRNVLQAGRLVGANLDILILELAIFIGCPIRIDIDDFRRKACGIQVPTGRFHLDGYGFGHLLLRRFNLFVEPGALLISQVFLLEEEKLVRIKRQILFRHLAEDLTAKPQESVAEFLDFSILLGDFSVLQREQGIFMRYFGILADDGFTKSFNFGKR